MTDVVFASLPLAAMAFGQRLGVSRASLLAMAGLDATQLDDPDGFVDYERLLALWDGLVARFPGRPLGMEYGDQLSLAVTGIVGQVCANAPTLRGALQAQLRFNELLDPRLEIAHASDGTHDRLVFSYDLPNPCIPDILEMIVTTTVRYARVLAEEPKVGPVRVCFHFSRRHPASAYESRTACPAIFDAGWTGIEFPTAFLDAPLPRAQPDAQRYLVQHAEHVLTARPTAGASIAAHVRSRIETTLTEGPPAAETVAAALGLSPRTLQRRLEAEATSLSEIVDDARRQRALALLQNPALTAQEVAFALGYADPRAFHRAFKRWTGVSPGQYRRAPQHEAP